MHVSLGDPYSELIHFGTSYCSCHVFLYKRRYGATQLIASYVFVIPRRNPLEILQFAVPSHVVLCVWPLFNVHK